MTCDTKKNQGLMVFEGVDRPVDSTPVDGCGRRLGHAVVIMFLSRPGAVILLHGLG